MNSSWEMQKVAAMSGLIDDTVRLAGTIREKRVADRAQQLAEQEFRAGYAKALATAKVSGDMPEQYQTRVPFDMYGRQVAVKVVALKELSRITGGKHPLANEAVRRQVGTLAMLNYNRADRPEGVNVADYAPSDEQLKAVFK
jgi:hypothetical protein